MHPVFFTLPIPELLIRFFAGFGITLDATFSIHTYGVMSALGFFLAITVVNREASRKGLDADTVTNLLFGNILWGVIGSRLLFVALSWQEYVDRPFAILNIREGGLVFQGGLIAAVVYSLYFVRRQRLPFWKTGDVLILGLLGHTFGRLGCLAAGCCYGKSTLLPWAITFTHPDAAGPPSGLPLHPVQLYESAGNLLIFVGLLYLLRRRLRFDGQVLLIYFMAYPILRIFTEVFRGDVVRGFLFEAQLGQFLSTSQAISMVELCAAVILYIWRRNRARGESLAEPLNSLETAG